MSKNIVNIVKYLSNNTGFEKITESVSKLGYHINKHQYFEIFLL